MNQKTTACFSTFNLSEPLNKALEDMNFTIPSPIQAEAIPKFLEGKDLIGLAQTGTGKTLAFALPILNGLLTTVQGTQALILAPTRELAIQVAEQFKLLCAHLRHVNVAVLCGGQEYGKQLKQLRQGAQIVVGTPGRIMDHIEKGTLNLSNLRTFILDEADEMLRMGFIDDVEFILGKLPEKKQIALFSATMPSRIRSIANTYLDNPVSVEIRMETATVKSVEQRFILVPGHQKSDALFRMLAVENHQGVIVFVRTKSSTEEVAEVLQQHGLKAMAIHGDITQTLRERIITQFKQGVIDILVATDVAARGLDVERVTHVINYDMPQDSETYVHRIGRTGRAGRSGVTILFATPKESRLVGNIERHTRQRIDKVTIPNDHTIQVVRQQQFMDNITARLTHEHIHSYKRIIEDYIKDKDILAVDVAAALALFLHKDMPWKKESAFPKTATTQKESRTGRGADTRVDRAFSRSHEDKKGFGSNRKPVESDRKKFDDKSSDVALNQFRLEVGRIHGVKPGNIVGAIANEAGLQSRNITRLKILDDHSLVCLPKGMTPEAMQDLTKAWVCGRQLKLTLIGSA
ncbi:MAG: DEAD/DEAH box helicase [Legionella sp.]|nr:DEAD/DEAH box helicase [Legionella sp.]